MNIAERFPGIVIQSLRVALCIFMSVVMLAGITQLGLRWEARQVALNSYFMLANGASGSGLLTQNWSGDIVLTDKQGNELTLQLSNLGMINFQAGQAAPAEEPWRLILSMIVGSMIAGVVSLGTLVATKSWVVVKPQSTARQSQARKSPDSVQQPR